MNSPRFSALRWLLSVWRRLHLFNGLGTESGPNGTAKEGAFPTQEEPRVA